MELHSLTLSLPSHSNFPFPTLVGLQPMIFRSSSLTLLQKRLDFRVGEWDKALSVRR